VNPVPARFLRGGDLDEDEPSLGLDHDCVISLDNVLTVPVRTLGYFSVEQEAQLARAVVLAYDLEVPLLE
jgi:mRNA interferase MazF